MKHLTIMLKPASSLCNLCCRYCFYTDIASLRNTGSYGVMSEETMQSVMDHIFMDLTSGDYLTLSFQGGEPMLAGLTFYRCLTNYVSGKNPGVFVNYTIQTNGVLLDDCWCRFLHEHHFLVGISFDILRESHEDTRIDQAGKGTYEQALQAISLLKKYSIEFNILCTLTRQTAEHPERVWEQIKKHQFFYVQFIPCLENRSAVIRHCLIMYSGRLYSLLPSIL